MTPSTARYAVTDPRTVEERLDQAEEFIYARPADEDETALAYNWLLRGRSHVPESPMGERGKIPKTTVTAGPGEPVYLFLPGATVGTLAED
ncbi:MAG: hypothetical protein ACE5OS_08165 [Anaerolineae bacterium]